MAEHATAPRLPVVALVGRPNVGKSTLFNRLTRSRDALVADQPGVTRDRQYGYARHGEQRLIAVDTGGIGQDDDAIDSRARVQTDAALAEADVVLFVVDEQDGLVTDDYAIATQLRRLQQPVLVVANKSEGLERDLAGTEFYGLGLGQPWAISAQRGDRINALLDHVTYLLPPVEQTQPETDNVRLALIGRPNAGKSTLVNRLLGEQRMLAMDVPGTTRDAITSTFTFAGESWDIVDTAGIRRRVKVRDPLEQISVIKAMQAAEQADVAIVLIDARAGLAAQDIRLLGLMQDNGRAAVIAVNKWDDLDEKQRQKLHAKLVERMGAYDYLPLCFISALHGTGLRQLLAAARASFDATTAELPTPLINRTLQAAITAHAPPAIQGRRIKLRFAHQGGRKPPTIIIHGNQTQRLSDEYKRYLMRRFREAFDLYGTPITLAFKNSHNPYESKRKR